jgi:hypothetical protein
VLSNSTVVAPVDNICSIQQYHACSTHCISTLLYTLLIADCDCTCAYVCLHFNARLQGIAAALRRKCTSIKQAVSDRYVYTMIVKSAQHLALYSMSTCIELASTGICCCTTHSTSACLMYTRRVREPCTVGC